MTPHDWHELRRYLRRRLVALHTTPIDDSTRRLIQAETLRTQDYMRHILARRRRQKKAA